MKIKTYQKGSELWVAVFQENGDVDKMEFNMVKDNEWSYCKTVHFNAQVNEKYKAGAYITMLTKEINFKKAVLPEGTKFVGMDGQEHEDIEKLKEFPTWFKKWSNIIQNL